VNPLVKNMPTKKLARIRSVTIAERSGKRSISLSFLTTRKLIFVSCHPLPIRPIMSSPDNCVIWR